MRRLIAPVLAVVLVITVAGTALATWPVANRKSYVSQWYSRRHDGIDIASYSGTKIYPAFSGRVIFAGWKNNGGGWQVWIKSSRSRTYAIYAHMKYRPRVRYNQTVYRQKTLIGYVGSTGNSTGPHLHLEIWKGWPWGRYSYTVNPWRYIDSGYWLPYRYR